MTKKEPKELRVGKILAAAIAEFVERGYENASVDSIAARAGLTKGGLYYHFTGKDDILIRANESFFEPIAAFMNQAMAMEKASRGLEFYIASYLGYWMKNPRILSFIFLSMTKAMTRLSLRQAYSGYTASMAGFFEKLYEKGIASGEFLRINTAAYALALLTSLDAAAGYLVIDHSLDPQKTIAGLVETFVTNFRKRTAD